MSERITTRIEGLECEVAFEDLAHAYRIEDAHDPERIGRFFGSGVELVTKDGETWPCFVNDLGARLPIRPGTVVLFDNDFEIETISKETFDLMLRDKVLIPFGENGYAHWTNVSFSRVEAECDGMIRAI
mgnify:FL=1